jgi:DNA polymerase-3 subunit gamma/tau
VLEVIESILAADAPGGLDHIHRTLDGGSDPRQFARQIVDYLRNLLLVRMGNPKLVDATGEVRSQMAQHAQRLEIPELLRVMRLFNQAAYDARSAWQPSLPLEVALVESIQQPITPSEKGEQGNC